MRFVGRLNKRVTLFNNSQLRGDSDGLFDPLSPREAWCEITPSGVTADGRGTEHRVRMRFHPQVSVDTKIVYSDPVLLRDRDLFVRSVVNVNEANVELELVCDEVQV